VTQQQRTLAQTAAIRVLRTEAADALATWIEQYPMPDGTKGMSVELLLEMIHLQEPCLRPMLDAMSRAPGWDPEVIRTRRPLIALMGVKDYWDLLKEDRLHEHCSAHAHALAAPEHWPHFARQMEAAKQLLMEV
jgi:hypothetical protein